MWYANHCFGVLALESFDRVDGRRLKSDSFVPRTGDMVCTPNGRLIVTEISDNFCIIQDYSLLALGSWAWLIWLFVALSALGGLNSSIFKSGRYVIKYNYYLVFNSLHCSIGKSQFNNYCVTIHLKKSVKQYKELILYNLCET